MVVGITSTTLISKPSSEVGRDFLSFPPAVTLAMTEMVDILFKKFDYPISYDPYILRFESLHSPYAR
jgi:hypothetical protein